MKRGIIGIVGLVLMGLMGLAGVAQAQGEELPDFSDPEILQKILGEAVPHDTLEERGPEGEEILYAPNSQTPYTGWVKIRHLNGKVRRLGHHKDGKKEGSETLWHEDGEKSEEATFKDGKQEGLVTKWHENGKVILQASIKDGKLLFLEGEPDLDDPKTLEEIVGKAVLWDTLKTVGSLYHIPGDLVPYTGWIKKLHDNGTMAALGALKYGRPDGLWTLWDEDGQKAEETHYRNGRKVVFE